MKEQDDDSDGKKDKKKKKPQEPWVPVQTWKCNRPHNNDNFGSGFDAFMPLTRGVCFICHESRIRTRNGKEYNHGTTYDVYLAEDELIMIKKPKARVYQATGAVYITRKNDETSKYEEVQVKTNLSYVPDDIFLGLL